MFHTILLAFFLLENSCCQTNFPQELSLVAEFEERYFRQVSSLTPVVFHYRQQFGSDGALQVHVNSATASESQPIIVIIKRKSSVISWQVPLLVDQHYIYETTSQILCPSRYLSHGNQQGFEEEMFVEIISLSTDPIPFNLQTCKYLNFEVSGLQSFVLQATPFSPVYVQYTMRDTSDRVLVQLKSLTANSTCAFFSIQAVTCPVGDLSASMRLSGRYQSVTTQGAIEVSRDSFPDGKFYIVLFVRPVDTACASPLSVLSMIRTTQHGATVFGEMRLKRVNITVTDDLEAGSVALAICIPILVFFLFSFLTVVLLQTSCRNWKAIFCNDVKNVELPTKDTQWRIARLAEKSITGKTVPFLWDPANYKYRQSSIYTRIHKNKLAQLGPIESILTLPDIGESSTDTDVTTEITRVAKSRPITIEESHPRSSLRRTFVADIFTKSPKKLTKTSREYSCTLMTVFIFYSLPVLQLVMTHQALLLVTGNEDICFYNFDCANRIGLLSDFNHIISNSGYAILGLLFLVIVRRRSVYNSKLRLKVPNLDEFGIPSQFGLFYGMGLALVMEGVMSACYHVCPSYNNFQFDTSFMYLLSGLLLLKLYHSRHPDVLPQSYAAYAMFAGFIFIAVVGVVTKDTVYWILFSVIHGLVSVSIGLQILVVGYIEFRPKKFYEAARRFKFTGVKEDTVPLNRIVLSTLIILVNIFFAISGPLLRSTDFASHLLFILQANLMIYAVFYMGMKVAGKEEKITWMTFLYFGLALPAWVVGIYFFTRALSNWELSPAISREGNKECFFFQFYDEHDVWHMCSAVGLFFTFMMLLNLDDDLATVEREDIVVF